MTTAFRVNGDAPCETGRQRYAPMEAKTFLCGA
jgi:hypothetical protein